MHGVRSPETIAEDRQTELSGPDVLFRPPRIGMQGLGGMQRPVGIAEHLPPQEDETLFRVELQAGKTVAVDPHNRYFFAGTINIETITGWGYPRYTVSDLGPMAGTRMAVAPDTPKEPRFVPIAGEPLLIRYNSKLPVVVYAPAEAEVRYRIWRTEATTQPIEIH